MTIHLEPTTFSLVLFDADELRRVAAEAADRAGLGDEDVHLQVDERSSLARLSLRAIQPVHLEVESGALEDPRRPRHLSASRASESLGRLFLEAADRRRPGFGGPALGEPVDLGPRVAWDVTLVARLARRGGAARPDARRYQFRVRHGFTDRADRVFDRLWSAGDDLSFADLEALSAEAAGEVPVSKH